MYSVQFFWLFTFFRVFYTNFVYEKLTYKKLGTRGPKHLRNVLLQLLLVWSILKFTMFQSRSTLTLVYSLQLLVKFKTLKFISIYRVIRLYFSANETKMCNVGNLLKVDVKGIQATTVDVFLCLFLLVLNTFSTLLVYCYLWIGIFLLTWQKIFCIKYILCCTCSL